MRAPWRKSNPVGPEVIWVDPEDMPRAQRDAQTIQALRVKVAALEARLSDETGMREYWRRMYYSILTVREAFEHAVESTGWQPPEHVEPKTVKVIPNTPDYLGEYPPLADVQSLHSYHEGPGL